MSQYTPSPINNRPPYQPNETQQERRAALHRFNRLYVYLPLGIVIALCVIAILLLFIGVFSPAFPGGADYASALADITLIMFLLPMIMLMLSGPALLVWLLSTGHRRRKEGKPRFDEGGRFQVWLWQMEVFLGRAQKETAVVANKVSTPIITVRSWLAFIPAFFKKIKIIFIRS
jgi:hypothetical protein